MTTSRTLLNYVIVVAMLFAGVVFARALAHAAVSLPDPETVTGIAQPVASTPHEVIKLVPSHPARLSIPSIDVDAKVQQVGLTATKNIGAPSGFSDVGWYVYGPVPGQPGTAVIDGHYDNGLGLSGVFRHLEDIKKGDRVYITTNSGKQLTFEVTQIDIFEHNKVPSTLFDDVTANGKGPAKLLLISCTGRWVSVGKTYDKRVFVTAVLK